MWEEVNINDPSTFEHLKSRILSIFTNSPEGYDLPDHGLLRRFTILDMRLSSKDQAPNPIRK